MYFRITLIVFLAFLATDSEAQFWKKKKKEKTTAARQPSSLDPAYAEKEYTPKPARKSGKGPTYGLEEEYYERMEDAAKAHRKAERMMEKPQYSDPMYFGHKRPPKKRKASKMKFCKVCGIRH